MPSTYNNALRLEMITTGEQAGVWGETTNTNLGTLLVDAVAGYTSVSITSASQALTALDGAEDQSRNIMLALTTTTTANFSVFIPPTSKTYIIYNASSYVATIYNSTVAGNTTAAGTGVAIPAGKTMTVWSEGTNVAQQNTHLISPTLASPTMTTPALGTPASGVLTNATGLPISTGVSGLGSGVATFLGTPSSANLAAAVSDETGSGALVFANSPTLTTPNLGTPSALVGTNISGTASGLSIGGNAATATAPASGGSFITSSNIGSQSVSFATTSGSTSGNAATATAPASGGSFITSSNIGSQSVNYANSAGSASSATTATTASSANAVVLSNTSNVNLTDYAIGTSVLAYIGSGLGIAYNRNAAVTVGIAGNESFTTTGYGVALSGTWRVRGYFAWLVSGPSTYEYYTYFTRTA